MSQLFLEDFALCCTGRSWLVSYLAQVSIYTLHTCRTMVEFGTIQQSRRSACHASCRHAKIGIISTQFGPRPLSKHVQALSWCPPASAMSGWASSPDASSSKRSPKASPGFWLNTNAFTHASRKSEGIQKRARSEAKALRVASSVLGVPGLIRLKTPSSWVRVCTCGTEVLVVESLSKAKKHRSRCSCSKIPHGHGCIYRLQWATKRRHGHQWTYANQSGSTRMTGSSPQTNQTVTSRHVGHLWGDCSSNHHMTWTCAEKPARSAQLLSWVSVFQPIMGRIAGISSASRGRAMKVTCKQCCQNFIKFQCLPLDQGSQAQAGLPVPCLDVLCWYAHPNHLLAKNAHAYLLPESQHASNLWLHAGDLVDERLRLVVWVGAHREHLGYCETAILFNQSFIRVQLQPIMKPSTVWHMIQGMQHVTHGSLGAICLEPPQHFA